MLLVMDLRRVSEGSRMRQRTVQIHIDEVVDIIEVTLHIDEVIYSINVTLHI